MGSGEAFVVCTGGTELLGASFTEKEEDLLLKAGTASSLLLSLTTTLDVSVSNDCVWEECSGKVVGSFVLRSWVTFGFDRVVCLSVSAACVECSSAVKESTSWLFSDKRFVSGETVTVSLFGGTEVVSNGVLEVLSVLIDNVSAVSKVTGFGASDDMECMSEEARCSVALRGKSSLMIKEEVRSDGTGAESLETSGSVSRTRSPSSSVAAGVWVVVFPEVSEEVSEEVLT